jgi:outer membrane protein assembly factor BamB
MRLFVKMFTSSRIVLVLTIFGGGLSCESASRLAPPPTDRVLWKVTGRGSPIVPSYDATSVFFASMDHHVVAIDKRDGTVRWQSSTGNGPGGATAGFNTVVANDVVAVGDVDIYAFDRTSGALTWSFRASDNDETGTHALATDGNVIYASSYFGRVYALDSHTGIPTWVMQLPGPTGVRTTTFDPVVAGGEIFVGLWYGTTPVTGGVAALDAVTGRLLWTYNFSPMRPDLESFCDGGAVIAGGLVIVSAGDGQIYGLDTATGALRWTAPQVSNYPTGDFRALALVNGVVLASSSSGRATGIDVVTGAIVWTSAVSGASLSNHVASDAQVAIFSTSELIAVDPQHGSVVWRTGVGKQGGDFWGYAAVSPDRIFANGIDGFYALKKE